MDRVDDVSKKSRTGGSKPAPKVGGTGQLQAPGQQQQGTRPEIGKDRGNTGFDVGQAMRNTGRLPRLGGTDIPKVGNDALDALRKGTGMLNGPAGGLQQGGSSTLDQLKALMARREPDAADAYGAADVFGVAKNARAFMAPNDMTKGLKLDGVDMLDDASQGGRMGKFMAGVGMGLAVGDLANQTQRAARWDELDNADRAAVCMAMAGAALAIVGTFCQPPANVAVHDVGAAFSLAAIGAEEARKVEDARKAKEAAELAAEEATAKAAKKAVDAVERVAEKLLYC